ncbi:MAG TPA: hypothetical protein VF808_17760 [Ktedonobacterales bacterium]
MLMFVMTDIAIKTSTRAKRVGQRIVQLFGASHTFSQTALDLSRRYGRVQSHSRTLRGLADPAQAALTALIVVISLALWGVSVRYVNVGSMNDLGLASVLPVGCYVALGGLTLAFCLALLGAREGGPTWILAFCLLALIFMLYGLPAIVEQAPRFQVTYWLAGHTEYIMRTGALDRGLDAYFNWPGFFILTGLLTAATGSQSVMVFAAWASLIYNLLYLPPLYMIYTTATRDRRLIWLGLWFFYITDWVWQDYYSPQGLNLFIYLIIIAILLKWFRTAQATPRYVTAWTSSEERMIAIETRPISLRATLQLAQARARAVVHSTKRPRQVASGFPPRLHSWLAFTDTPTAPGEMRQRIALFISLLAIFFFSVSSHPITPFFILLSVSALVMFGQIRPRWLPVLLAALIIGWDFTVAQPYMVGHIATDLSAIGNLGASTKANVSGRLAVGSPQHQLVAQIRVGLTAIIWGLALLGAALRWRRDSTWYAGESSWGTGSLLFHDLKYLLLAVTPMLMVALQPYGGEMAMRSYLFSLPIVALFAAAAFCSPDVGIGLRGFRALSVATTALTCLILLAAFMLARYGNERADYYTYNETNAVAFLYSVAPRHSLLLQGWTGTPWRNLELEQYDYFPLYPGYQDARTLKAHNVDGIIASASSGKYPETFIIFTRSQKAQAEMFYSVPASDFDAIELDLIASGRFTIIYSNPDAVILLYEKPAHAHVAIPFTDTPIYREWSK